MKCRKRGTCVCSKELGERMKAYVPLLKKLNDADETERAAIILKAPTCFIRFMCECGLNILKQNLTLSKAQYEKLSDHKRLLLYLSQPYVSFKKRRSVLLKKEGGFLPALTPILLSALAGFVGQAASKLLGLS